MTALDPLDVSARVVAERFPEAIAAFLAGSVLTSRRTALSDLDIVVVLPGPPAPFRDTVRAHGWVVELFVHTPTSIAHYWQTDRVQWRCTLAGMCAEGRLLVDVGGAGGRLQQEARALLEAGPPRCQPRSSTAGATCSPTYSMTCAAAGIQSRTPSSPRG